MVLLLTQLSCNKKWQVKLYLKVLKLSVLHISSYIRGYHAYMEVWTPVQDEMLILKHEPTNVADRNAVAVFKEDQVVGHVPFNLAQVFHSF